MRITVRMFAHLSRYLPPGARENQIELEVPEGIAPSKILEQLGVSPLQCHLLLVNGVYIPPSERNVYILRAEDVMALWPPVAGG